MYCSIIGRNGSNINDIERFLNVHVDVVAKDSEESSSIPYSASELPFTFSESKTALLLTVNREYASRYVDVYASDHFVTSVRIGRKGQIKIPKRSDAGRSIMELSSSQNDLKISLKDF